MVCTASDASALMHRLVGRIGILVHRNDHIIRLTRAMRNVPTAWE
jgi:hypothetical protein